jgi:hypothetical protein
MIYLDLESEAGLEWLRAHKRKPTKAVREMPRFLLEQEIAQHMLADKQAHAARDLGAKPRNDLPFAMFANWKAPQLRSDDATPRDWAASVDFSKVQDEAQKCVSLWRAVIEKQAFDLLKMWGASKEDYRSARMFFESKSERWTRAREEVCHLALLDPEAVCAAHKAGRFKLMAKEAIGRERYTTRLINAQPKADQPDLFYSMGVR